MAAARLKAVEKALAPGPVGGQVEDSDASPRLVLVLPDLSPAHIAGRTILINHVPILRFETSSTQTYQHLRASLNTPQEASARHVPNYPLLTLYPISADLEGSHKNGEQSKEKVKISIEDFWSCMYTLHYFFNTQEIIPVTLAPTIENGGDLATYALHSGLAIQPQRCHGLKQIEVGADVLLFERGALYQGAGTTTYHTRGFLRSQAELAPNVTGTRPSPSSSATYAYPPYPPYPYAPGFTRTPVSITAHPRRPPRPKAGEVLYRRWCREAGMMLELRTADFGQDCAQSDRAEDSTIPLDLALYNKWHNAPHVARAWHHTGSLEFHRRYLQRMWNNEPWLSGGPHASSDDEGNEEANAGGGAIGLVMCWDGEPMGWAEVLYVKENHLGPHVPGGAHDYDRGLHVLLGEKKFSGAVYSKGWFKSIVHMLFLFDPRTERVFGEPDSSNKAILEVCMRSGMNWDATFDFPYKRSAMMIAPRYRFFQNDM